MATSETSLIETKITKKDQNLFSKSDVKTMATRKN